MIKIIIAGSLVAIAIVYITTLLWMWRNMQIAKAQRRHARSGAQGAPVETNGSIEMELWLLEVEDRALRGASADKTTPGQLKKDR